jgi:hypothetical protein
MNCEFWRGRVTDLARDCGPDADARIHLGECPDCAQLFKEQAALTILMQELARDETAEPPREIESFLVREFDAARSHWTRRRRWRLAAGLGAIAATVGCFALLRSGAPRVEVKARPVPAANRPAEVVAERGAKPVRRAVRRRQAPKADEDAASPFITIPYTLPLDPREPVALMRVALPVTALVAVGLAAAAPDPAAIAQADALVSEDGRIRAVRLVSFESSDFGSDRRAIP